MKERLVCHNRIRKLLVALLGEPDPGRLANIVKQEQFPPRAPLSWVLGECLSGMYYAALNEVVEELVPHHASQSDLAQAFWELFGEVAADPSDYSIRGKLTKRLDKFAEEWKGPLKLYEVAYRIENLNLGTESFTFGNVRFFTMVDAELARWGISKNDARFSRAYSNFVDQPVAAIQVQAANNERAYETGLQEFLFGLDLLRLAGRWGFISTLQDQMCLWRFEGHYVARQVRPPHPYPSWGWLLTFSPLSVKDMGAHIRKGLDSKCSSLLTIANGELPDEITVHLKRAINWISTSITRERLDDKIVDLCTALEIMLLPSYTEGGKGQLIDLRQRLIGGSTVPGGVLNLYELRSDIVHGSALNMSRPLDYWHLLLVCFGVLQLLVNLAKKNPHVQNLKDLINACETTESLTDFIYLCEVSPFKGKLVRKVKQLAKQRLNKLQGS